LQVEKTASFPIEDALTKQVTQKHEDFFQAYLKDYGYYDVFIISAQNAQVMYTACKESDYGANLLSGSLKESGLGEVSPLQTLK